MVPVVVVVVGQDLHAVCKQAAAQLAAGTAWSAAAAAVSAVGFAVLFAAAAGAADYEESFAEPGWFAPIAVEKKENIN